MGGGSPSCFFMFTSEIWCSCAKTRYSYASPNYIHLGVHTLSPYSRIWNNIKECDLIFCSFPKSAYSLLGVHHDPFQCIFMHMLIHKCAIIMFVGISGFMNRLCEIVMCRLTLTKPGLILCMREIGNISGITLTNLWMVPYTSWWIYWQYLNQ